jgi:hypothetical protein
MLGPFPVGWIANRELVARFLGCTYLMMKTWVLMGPRLTLEGAASYKYTASTHIQTAS